MLSKLNARFSQPDDYHLSAVFTASKAVKAELRRLLQQCAVDAQKLAVKPGQDEDLQIISLDLFSG